MHMDSKARGRKFTVAQAKSTVPACISLPCQAPEELAKTNPLVHCPGPHEKAARCTVSYESAGLLCAFRVSAGMHHMQMYHEIMAVAPLLALVICQLRL